MKLSVLAFLYVSFAAGQNSGPYYTDGFANGRMWTGISASTMKAMYVMAYREGVAVATAMMQDHNAGSAIHRVLVGSKLNAGEIASAVDRFYADPLNMPLQVNDAISIVIEQATGEAPEKVDRHLRDLRKQVNAITPPAAPR